MSEPVKTEKPQERKPDESVKVELLKVRRELLTLANRVEKLIKGQETA